MYRNNNVCTINLKFENLSESNIEQNILEKWGGEELLLQKYIEGIQIVFVTCKNILLGAITEGDICRFFRKNNNINISKIVNTNIKRIVFVSEEQVFEDARKIFNINDKIHNIPVVNKIGELLFQIDRFSGNLLISRDLENILNSAKNGAIKCFLEADDIKEIIITGSYKKSLYQAKQIFYECCSDLISKKNIKITIKDNITEVYISDNNIKIISLSKIGAIYLNKISKLYRNVITSEELYYFSEFDKIKNFDKDIINNFIEIFKYKRINIYLLNKYTSFLIKLMNLCDVDCFYVDKKGYFENNNIAIFDIFLFSGDKEEYCERENIIELIQNIELVQKYKQITGNYLTHNEYIMKCVDYLYKLQKKGFDGFLQEINSYWQEELHEKIKAIQNFEIIDSLENIDNEKKYVDAYQSVHKLVNKNFYMSTRMFLIYICEYSVYKILIKKCKNVFVFSTMFTIYNDTILERNRENYLKDNSFFENNFTKDICNNDKNYLTEVIKNRENCEIIRLNNGYIKFLSNYHSKYFNTDLYGNRIVSYNPKEYSGIIWLVGGCTFNGYAVEDKHTFASFLQNKINSAGYKYKVIDLSCDNDSPVLKLYNKILERDIALNDIIILNTNRFFKEDCFININCVKMNNYFNKIWFWDFYSHPGLDGYRFWAEETFQMIKHIMEGSINNVKFYLEKELEVKIHNYISEIKQMLKVNKIYQSVFANMSLQNTNKKPKIGAVVMNCNPFTYGHQYLIDTASKLVDLLFVFVVEENKSFFSFEDRFSMVKDATKEYNNVIVLPSGKFMISSVTFPGYFFKEKPTEKCYDDFLDLSIFAYYISPGFGINIRFVGEEPFDKITSQYNYDMKKILKNAKIDIIEIPRKKIDNKIISATKVRELLKKRKYDLLEKYVPKTTIKYL